jgi:putative CocE/NonD family hydrolase
MPKGTHTDVRDKAFWDERRLIDKFPGVTTSVLLVDGFQDSYWSGHQLQANEVWNLLPNAPKQMLVGQWGHSFPNYNTYNRNWAMADWNDRLLTWLDHWLKGIGSEPAGLGTVEYQEGLYEDQPSVFSSSLPGPAPAFQSTTAWPPPAAKDEVLYLSNGKLTGSPQGGSASFRSYNNPDAHQDPQDLLCPRGIAEVVPASVMFVSEPVRKPVAVAGNPFAYLKLSSDLPGGLVAVNLFDLAPDFACVSETPTGVKMWSTGAADLRFHKGNFTGEPFPVGTPTHVRVDLTDFVERLEPGHRLAVVLSRGDTWDRMGTPVYQPGITVHADGGSQASHLVLPVVQGKLGERRPGKLDYPPRPFLPTPAN